MKRNLAFGFLEITEQAALSVAPVVGQGDKEIVDRRAVEAIRETAVKLPSKGEIVVGEGEKDKAPKLDYGEQIGGGAKCELDIAVDPIEGTEFAAAEAPNSLAVIAAVPRGNLLSVPDIYMNKIVVGPQAKGTIDLQAKPADNLAAVAEALDKSVSDLTVVVLDRPRHRELIKEVYGLGANLKLISGVDIVAGLAAALPEEEVDVAVGIGGAPEGILTAAAVKVLGGDMEAQLMPRNQTEMDKITGLGVSDINQIFGINQLVAGEEIIFSLTGVTDGELLAGVKQGRTNSLLLQKFKDSMRSRELTTNYSVDRKVS